MKVKLIFPQITDNIGEVGGTSLLADVLCRILGWGKTSYTPPLSLLMLGAVTPEDIDIQILDERIERIDYDDPVDLVGVTVVTRSAPRSYEIAREYRERGVKVVLGGVHPSALPQEASLNADTIVVGEGEGVWPELLKDFKAGKMAQVYRGHPQMNLDELPFPRRQLIRRRKMYVTDKAITATRGCPNTCTFCAAGVGLSKKYRKRSVDNVIQELEQVPGKLALFMDDNLGWDINYAKALIKAMIPLKLRWSGPISANALDDPELIELAAQSGCFMLGVGFESLSPKVISAIRKDKTNHPERYAEQIKRAQEAGIIVWGNFVVGFDDESPQTFQDLTDFIQRTNLEIASVYILTPYPGSVLYRKYERENRLIHKSWRFYEPSSGYCVIHPKQMTPQELMDGYMSVLESVYSPKAFLSRLFRSETLPSMGTFAGLHINLESYNELKSQKAALNDYLKEVIAEPAKKVPFETL